MTYKIGKIIAIYLIATGIGFLVSSEYYSKMIANSSSDPVLINLSGMVHFFIGMIILVNHFLWKNALQIIVTLLGLMFFLKGFFLIIFPEFILQSAGNTVKYPLAMPMGFIGVGIILGYLVFFKEGKSN
ncbi:hypothetical protein [Aquimarina algiphila]|uniref:hypothetical protein n=1 Tax=Aquimarina algiphila TaxID=2047982 RepID=UPI002492EDC2|nr:hypothetical protein [Aquimarina algiphila]